MRAPDAFGDFILVRPAEFSQELASGLRLPDIAKDKAWYGLVVGDSKGPSVVDSHVFVFFNRTASFDFVREIDDIGIPSGRMLCSVPRQAIMARWLVSDRIDVERILNPSGQAIDHEMEKDVRKRIQGT